MYIPGYNSNLLCNTYW